jgi:hypothetical protein
MSVMKKSIEWHSGQAEIVGQRRWRNRDQSLIR